MKLSIELKPAPTWKVPVGFSATSTLMSSLSAAEPCSVRRRPLEVTERRHAALAVLEARLAEELSLLDLHLAADHLVARLLFPFTRCARCRRAARA